MNLVITPTLNERENIDAIVDAVLSFEQFSLLVVDDNSPDRTWERVEELQEKHSRLHLLRRLENPGFRNSYLDGFRWAMKRDDVEFIFTIDADLSHPPRYLPDLLNRLENGADLAVGSRYAKGGGVENWPFRRRFLSRNANRFARFVTGLPVRDCTAGFNGIRVSLLRDADLTSIHSTGYAFLIELKHLLWRLGAEIKETPIIFTDREHGATKFNSGMIGEAMKTCFRLRSRNKSGS